MPYPHNDKTCLTASRSTCRSHCDDASSRSASN